MFVLHLLSTGRFGVREAVADATPQGLGYLDEARKHAAACERYGDWGDNARSRGLASLARGRGRRGRRDCSSR